MIFKKIKEFSTESFGKLRASASVFFAFSFLILLFAANTAAAAKAAVPVSDLEGYAEVLTQSGDCEAPALRQRLGQQLRLNARNLRSGYQYSLQRNTSISSRPVPELLPQPGIRGAAYGAPYEEVSTYRAYSRYILPVRAGPFSTCD